MGGRGSGQSKKPITRERPRTRWFCHWKPRRKKPRTIGVKEAARICCAAVRNGAEMREIDERVAADCPTEAKARDQEADASVAQIAVEMESMIGMMDGVLGEAYQEFLIINGIIGAIVIALALFGRFPGLRIVSRRAIALQAPIGVVMSRIIGARAAANDAKFLAQVLRARALRAA